MSTKQITVIAGTGGSGYTGDGGPALSAQLNAPWGLAFDSSGNLYIADWGNGVVREIDSATGIISTYANVGRTPGSLVFDASGNLYIGIADSTGVFLIEVLASSHNSAWLPANGDSAYVLGIGADAAGNIYYSTWNKIWKYTPSNSSSSVYAGQMASGYSANGSLAVQANLYSPSGIALDSSGNLYVADTGNNVVREIYATSGYVASGEITTIAGNYALGAGYSGDGGAATSAQLYSPTTIAFDTFGNLYIADSGNKLIREVDLVSSDSTYGYITTVAGGGGSLGIGNGNALDIGFSDPTGVWSDYAGNLFVADQGEEYVYEITGSSFSARLNGLSKIVAGVSANGYGSGIGAAGYTGDGSAAIQAKLNSPWTIVGDWAGNLLIVDSYNNVIREVAGIATPWHIPGTALTASLSSLLFTSSVGNTSAAQTVTITNSGTGAVAIASIALSGTNAAVFSQSNSCGSSLAAGSTCTVSVSYTPTAVETDSATLQIISDAANSPLTVALTGKSPAVLVSPSSLTLTTAAGTTSGASAVTLTNSGASAIAISSIALSGNNASFFAQSNTCGSTLNASSSCTISVTYSPTAVETDSATLITTDSDANSPQTVSLTGNVPVASLTPSSLAFIAGAGATSTAQTATLTNSGTGPLTISSTVLSDTSNFSQADMCGSTLAAGSSCNISISFSPSAIGSYSATLQATDNASGSPQTISLTGTVPGALISPSSLTFDTMAGSTSSAKTVTLTNNGTAPLTISPIGISGNGASSFAQTNTCVSPLAAGASCTISLTFSPTALEVYSATLQVVDNGNGNLQTVALSGTGTMGTPLVLLTITPSAPSLGSTITLTALVGPVSGLYPPASEIVTFYDNGISLGTGVLNSAGVATFTSSSGLAAGQHTFTATYPGDSSFNAATSNAIAVSAGNSSSPGASLSPASLTFSAQVGTTSAAQTVTLSNNDTASLALSSIEIGGASASAFSETNNCGTSLASGSSCSISITFTPSVAGGFGAFLMVVDNATSSPQLMVLTGTGTAAASPIGGAGTASYVQDETITQGTSTATLTALVSYSGTTAPSGAISFQVGSGSTVTGTCLGTGYPLICTASYPTSWLTAGTYTLTATQDSDDYYASGSATGTLIVIPTSGQAASPLLSTDSYVESQAITQGTSSTLLTAQIAYTGIAPTGAVSFAVGNGASTTGSCSGAASPLVCTASYATSSLTKGAYVIRATEAADANYAQGSSVGILTVDTASTIAAPLSTSPSYVANVSIPYGSSITTLTAVIVYTGTAPAGKVTFTVNGGSTVTASCTGVSSTLTCTAMYPTSSLAIGSYAIVASEASDGTYPAGTGTGTLTVTQATPAVTVNGASIISGASTATLTGAVAYSGALAPTGKVTFTVNGMAVLATCSGTYSPLTCTAIYSTSTLMTGTYTIAATLVADENYATATGMGTLTVLSAGQSNSDFAIAVTPTTSQTVHPGSTASYAVVVSYLQSAFNNPVTLTVTTAAGQTGLPTGATAIFAPASVVPGNASASSTLTIQTSSTVAHGGAFSLRFSGGISLGLLSFPLLGLGLRRRLAKHCGCAWSVFALVLLSLSALLSMTGCGNGSGYMGSNSKTYTFTVTGTSGTLTHTASQTVTLTLE